MRLQLLEIISSYAGPVSACQIQMLTLPDRVVHDNQLDRLALSRQLLLSGASGWMRNSLTVQTGAFLRRFHGSDQ